MLRASARLCPRPIRGRHASALASARASRHVPATNQVAPRGTPMPARQLRPPALCTSSHARLGPCHASQERRPCQPSFQAAIELIRAFVSALESPKTPKIHPRASFFVLKWSQLGSAVLQHADRPTYCDFTFCKNPVSHIFACI